MSVKASGNIACNSCGEILSEHRPGSEKICLPCRRERGRRHYRQNRTYYLEKARRQRAVSTARAWEYVLSVLEGRPCYDCGQVDVRVLEFDHRDRRTKRASVAVLVAEGYGLDAIAREIEKCDVRCANCHIIKTREEAGWFRSETWRARRDSNSQPFDP